jgi:hypothetical protein
LKINLLLAIVLFLLAVSGAGCTEAGPAQSSDTEPAQSNDTAAVQQNADKTVTGNSLGIDLTAMDPLVAADIAHRISEYPEGYLGAAIKLSGRYEVAENHNTGGYIHAIVVSDQVACCEAVIEFVWNGEHSYPGDYPREYEQIELEGVMKRYEEAGEAYYYLAVDDMTRKKNGKITN